MQSPRRVIGGVVFKCFLLCVSTAFFLSGCSSCSSFPNQKEIKSEVTEKTAGELELNKVAKLSWDADTFLNASQVRIQEQQSDGVAEDFKSTLPTEGTDGFQRAKNEIRITTGKTQPSKSVSIRAELPQEIRTEIEKGKALFVFVQYFYDGDNETLDSFLYIDFDLTSPSVVSFKLDPGAFTNLRNEEQAYEAIVVLATGRSRK